TLSADRSEGCSPDQSCPFHGDSVRAEIDDPDLWVVTGHLGPYRSPIHADVCRGHKDCAVGLAFRGISGPPPVRTRHRSRQTYRAPAHDPGAGEVREGSSEGRLTPLSHRGTKTERLWRHWNDHSAHR